MLKMEKIDHICIAVKDIEKAEEYVSQVFGLKPDDRYVEEAEKISVVRYYIGEVGFELMAPTAPDEGEVAKFLNKYGEGFFLISFKVSDVNEALKELKEKQVPLIDEVPRKWRNSNYIFLKPGAFFGTLVELID